MGARALQVLYTCSQVFQAVVVVWLGPDPVQDQILVLHRSRQGQGSNAQWTVSAGPGGGSGLVYQLTLKFVNKHRRGNYPNFRAIVSQGGFIEARGVLT